MVKTPIVEKRGDKGTGSGTAQLFIFRLFDSSA